MNDLQRNREWYLERKGKITASECYVLLSDHKETMTEEELAKWKTENPKSRVTTKTVPFSDTTFTYLDGKVAEMFMPEDNFMMYIENCRFESAAMKWGTVLEDDARKRYMKEMGVEVLDAPFVPLKDFHRFAGGSPDGIVREDNGIIEIKCPYNPAVHLKHFLFENGDDLKEENLQYYVQCQCNMLCVESSTGIPCNYCDFISYDPRVSADKQIKILRIFRDAELCDKLISRIILAVSYFKEKIDKINETNFRII